MKNAIELRELDLELVTGGDNGDAAKDTGAEPRYKVGQEVEVYTGFLHAFTRHRKILSAQMDKVKGHWCYIVDSLTQRNEHWEIDADDIESN